MVVDELVHCAYTEDTIEQCKFEYKYKHERQYKDQQKYKRT